MGFIQYQCEKTQTDFINGQTDPRSLALRLDFLMGYYDHYSKKLNGSPEAQVVWQHYCQTLTNAVKAFRQMTTNDLGNDPRAWIEKYEDQ